MSRLFLSSPVILTRKYGSFLSYFVPFAPVVTFGDTSPGSGCPYICGCLPYRPPAAAASAAFSGVTGVTGRDGRGRLGMGVLGVRGVVGHGGGGSSPNVELSGSNMDIVVVVDEERRRWAFAGSAARRRAVENRGPRQSVL